jgi:hypothetical protein
VRLFRHRPVCERSTTMPVRVQRRTLLATWVLQRDVPKGTLRIPPAPRAELRVSAFRMDAVALEV